MKKIVLTFGLISGVILSAMMAITMPFHDKIGYDKSEILGYTTMVLAFLLIFFGVRAYRDNVAGGTVRFGRAFGVGMLIAAVASVCYVATWEVIYFNFAPDFVEKYQEHLIAMAKADGATEQELAKQKADFEKYAVMYRNPAINAAVTFLEPMPVALVMSLVTAGVLSRRKKSSVGQAATVGVA